MEGFRHRSNARVGRRPNYLAMFILEVKRITGRFSVLREPLRFSWGHWWNYILLIMLLAGLLLWRSYGLDGRIVFFALLAWIAVGRIFTPWIINEHIGFFDRWVFHDYYKAHQRYRKAIDSGNATAMAYCALGSLALAEGDVPEAASLLEEAVARLPRDFYAYVLLSRVLGKLGRYEEALGTAIRCQEISNRNSLSYAALGDALKVKGEITAAVSAYQKALEIAPRFRDCYLRIGEVYLNQGQLGIAEENFKKAFSISPENPDVLYWMGRVMREKGDLGAARRYLQKALERRPPRDYSYTVPYKEVVKTLGMLGSLGLPSVPGFNNESLT